MSRLDKVLTRRGDNKDLDLKSKPNTKDHFYSPPSGTKITPHVRALWDYWGFVDLINYKGGRKEFDVEGIHGEMAEFLYDAQLTPKERDERILRRMMLVPRGHLKTTLVEAYILWRIYRNPDIRILVLTATKDLALLIVKHCKQLLEDEQLGQDVWNNRPHYRTALIPSMDRGMTYRRRRQQRRELIEDNTETEAADKKIIWRADALQVIRPMYAKEPTLMAASTNTNITGMHFDLIICDDIINEDLTNSPEKIQKTQDWAEDLEFILDPDRSVAMGGLGAYEIKEIIGGEKVVIGTRYAKGDYYEYIEENKTRLGYATFHRNIYKNGVDDSDGYLWEAKFNARYVERLRERISTRKFGSQYLNTIITAEEQILDRDKINYYAPSSVERDYGTVRIHTDDGRKDLKPFLVVDPAISQKKGADYSVIMVGAMSAQRDLYILDAYGGHPKPYELLHKMFDMMSKWHLKLATVEVVSYQQALVYMAKQLMGEHFPIAINEFRPKGEKKARIETNLEPLMNREKVYMPSWMANIKELQEEIYYFPAENVHDDWIDAMSMLVEVCTPSRDDKRGRALSRRLRTRAVNRKWGGVR